MIRCLRIVFIAVALLFATTLHAQERHLRSYTLQHALPEQVIPALSAQLSAGSSVTPYRQQLILNVTDGEFRTLQTLLEQLDTAPRSLMISVRKQSQQLNDDEHYNAQVHIGDGAVQVQSGNDWQRHSETRVIVDRSTTQGARDGAQQVRAVEGMQTFISAGNTVSMRSGSYGGRELVPVESGFYATARIVGNEVIVDIDQRDDRVQGRSIATQSLQTQVRGSIGTWIPLGALSNSLSGSERALTTYGNSASSAMADLAIKVELLDR